MSTPDPEQTPITTPSPASPASPHTATTKPFAGGLELEVPLDLDGFDPSAAAVEEQPPAAAASAGSTPLRPPPPAGTLRQLILPTDRRNPSISLYRFVDVKGLPVIQVYYGFELLEEVADDFSDPTFRCMIARLYNARLKLKTLVEVFKIDPKTIRSWGEALTSRDPKRMSVMFFGPDAARKRTRQIEAFVSVRLPELKAQGVRNYRVKLQQEIETIFHTRLSGETLRILMAGLKLACDTDGLPASTPESEQEEPAPPATQTMERTLDLFSDESLATETIHPTETVAETVAETGGETGIETLPTPEVASENPESADSLPGLPTLMETSISALEDGVLTIPTLPSNPEIPALESKAAPFF